MQLTRDEEARLKADKEFINNFANKDKLYAKVMGDRAASGWDGFFFIQKLLYNGQLDQVKYNKMQEFYNEQVGTILDVGKFTREIDNYYKTALAAQKVKFGSGSGVNYTAYFDALKNSDSKTPFAVYQPTDDFFYVKHILLPFSDAQKADITKKIAAEGWNSEGWQAQEYREKVAEQIKSYRHSGGEDVKTAGVQDIAKDPLAMDIKDIYNEIVRTMTGISNLQAAEEAFQTLVQKYNTDPGIFNNEKGYLIPPKGKGLSSGYVAEFDRGAYDLFNGVKYQSGTLIASTESNTAKGKPGELLERYVVTEYGVHIMYYSQQLGRTLSGGTLVGGEVSLLDYTSQMRLSTYQQAIFEEWLKTEQQDYFNRKSSEIVNTYIKPDADYVVKYENRYKDLWENSTATAS
jgi:hypothetical protein